MRKVTCYKNKKVMLALILALRAVVRIWGAINNMIPTSSELNFLHAIEQMTNSVSLDSQYYNHPDNVILMVGFIVINVFSLISNHTLCTGSIKEVISGNTTPPLF